MATDQAVISSVRVRRESASQTQGMSDGRSSFAGYETTGFYDEMFDSAARPRVDCQPLFERMRGMSADDLIRRQRAADRSMVQLGITFTVYGDRQGSERIMPFDIIPRIVCHNEWQRLERGLQQRITALNLFLEDMYHEQRGRA